ncbi:hypothetical protein Sjap_005561 [Stephania japonica]|uniref:Uncharacterized protein n=1 Tax=Stephania japonica TaxID=461633 RepID=A0AAP0PI36_9MAGN
MALSTTLHFISSSPSLHSSVRFESTPQNPWTSNLPIMAKRLSQSGSSHRRVWRRRKLTKKDKRLQYNMERVPFLEEQVRKIRETENLMTGDIARLLLSEENRFDFVNEVAAEAKAYVENNRDEYGSKKAILHVLSNRMNDAGFERPEAYMETDPFNPGPNYLREVL